ncbi:hypothetical protein L227DRAFT_568879, partial [Lentinus tigrinus ALCF2SS1-6]
MWRAMSEQKLATDTWMFVPEGQSVTVRELLQILKSKVDYPPMTIKDLTRNTSTKTPSADELNLDPHLKWVKRLPNGSLPRGWKGNAGWGAYADAQVQHTGIQRLKDWPGEVESEDDVKRIVGRYIESTLVKFPPMDTDAKLLLHGEIAAGGGSRTRPDFG